jgi:surface protein
MFLQLKSQLVWKIILEKLNDRSRHMKLLKYNKTLQKKFGLSLNDYKNYIQLKIELIPIEPSNLKRQKNFFINSKAIKNNYTAYINDNKKLLNRDYFTVEDKVSKINLMLHDIGDSLKDLFNIQQYGSFAGCDCIKEIKFIMFNKKNIKDMSFMFHGCTKVTNVEFSEFHSKNVKNMSYMFYGCSSLVNLDLSKLDTENVTNMFCMFSKCSSLKELDFSKFNTINVVNMGNMFEKCSKLKNMKNFNFSTYNVTNMSCMFEDCSSINYINSSHFLTNNVYSFDSMFKNCFLLTYLDISYFHFRYDATMREMFCNCDYNFKKEMKSQNSKLKPEAFYDDDDKSQIRNNH